MKQLSCYPELLSQWASEYRNYFKQLDEYSKIPKLVRWLKGIEPPKHPRFHSVVLLKDFDEDVVIELRCYCGLYLAINQAGSGYKYNLCTQEKEPLLGAKSKKVDKYYDAVIESIANHILNLNINLKPLIL